MNRETRIVNEAFLPVTCGRCGKKFPPFWRFEDSARIAYIDGKPHCSACENAVVAQANPCPRLPESRVR